jgi:putative NADH-flavin reductase
MDKQFLILNCYLVSSKFRKIFHHGVNYLSIDIMELKTIALFGGSGRTGKLFIMQAAEKYRIRALVRNPQKLQLSHPNLELIQGDTLNATDVEKTIQGADGVVSLLGHVEGSQADFQTRSITHAIGAMKKHGVKRLLSLTGGGVPDPVNDKPGLMDKAILFIMGRLTGRAMRNRLLDGIEHGRVIQASGLDWTIVRAPVLTLEPATHKTEVGHVGRVKGIKLTREDLAAFILKEIEEGSYIGKLPYIVNIKS